LDIYNKIKPLLNDHVDKINAISVPFQDDSPSEETADEYVNYNENKGSACSLEAKSNSLDNLKDLEASLEEDKRAVTDFAVVTEEVQNDLKDSIGQGDKIIRSLSEDKNRSDENETGNMTGTMTSSTGNMTGTMMSSTGNMTDTMTSSTGNMTGTMTSSTASEEFDDLFDDEDNSDNSVETKSNVTEECVCPEDVKCCVAGATAEKKQVEDVKRLSLVSLNLDDDLSSLTKDVHSYLNKLLWLFIIAYEELDTTVGRDNLYVSLEDPFFKPIWHHLLLFFR
jgi:hypothetical protein